eukprot:TRINITY_DN13154_c0_g1_i3.p1 TRINITY_DN13154_c0_g1~~TRINITY_DN13154_c0_g1_i3.p1  ORF type:complete len:371 (+),score=62.90 TRINITY_DN13154_c0_g1_i3:153-1265(+)
MCIRDRYMGIEPKDKKEQPKNEMPEMDKYCAIYKTLGERRLGTHLINGMMRMLGAISKVAVKTLTELQITKIRTVFPQMRAEKKSIETYKMIRNKDCPIVDGKTLPLKDWCSNPIYTEEDYKNLISFEQLQSSLTKEILTELKVASQKVEEWVSLLGESLSKEKNHFLNFALNKLEFKEKSVYDFMIDIAARIGFECGRIKRAMQDNDINWGTFIDHSPLELHCNSHANNFVVIPKGYHNLLAPLDFDLSISRSTFICIVPEREAFGKPEPELFDSYVNTERIELSRGLGGEENMNFVYTSAKSKENPLELSLAESLEFILRDIMVSTYMKTFDQIKCDYVIPDPDKCEEIQALVKIALILTDSLIAQSQ